MLFSCLRPCSDSEFVQVDGTDISTRLPAISSQGKWLTLWLSRSTILPSVESILPTHNETFLSPPQSASSTTQLIPSVTTHMDTTVPYQTASTITFDTLPLPSDTPLDDDDQFWNLITEQTIPPSSSPPAVNDDDDSNTNNDTISDLYLTLLHGTNKKSSPITSRSEHDRAVNAIASEVLWPLIVDQTNRRSEKKFSSSTTTTQSISSTSSTSSSTLQRNSPFKQLSSTVKTRRAHPYSTA